MLFGKLKWIARAKSKNSIAFGILVQTECEKNVRQTSIYFHIEVSVYLPSFFLLFLLAIEWD